MFSCAFTCCISWLNCVKSFEQSRQGLQSINRLNTFQSVWSVFCNMLLNTSVLTSWEPVSSYGDITVSFLLFAQLCECVWKSQRKRFHSINRLNVGILAVASGLKHVKDINLNLLRPRVLIWGCCILAFLLIILYSAKYFTLFLFCFMLYNEPTVPIF